MKLNLVLVYQLKGGIGSIQAIARASKEYILEKTDLSPEKAEMVFNFFRDPKLYLSPEINSLNTSNFYNYNHHHCLAPLFNYTIAEFKE